MRAGHRGKKDFQNQKGFEQTKVVGNKTKANTGDWSHLLIANSPVTARNKASGRWRKDVFSSGQVKCQ